MSCGVIGKAKGFTLIELMIVLAILTILMTVALPAYQNQVNKGRRSDGQALLLDVASKMERHFYQQGVYTVDLTDLGFATTNNVDSQESFYQVSVAAATAACPVASCYVLQAVAQGGQANDGTLTLSSLGEKTPADKW